MSAVAGAATMRLLGSHPVSGAAAVDDVPGLVQQLRPFAARDVPVLAVTAAADAATARRTLSLARAGAPGATALVHGSSLPPLARRGLLEVLGALSCSTSRPMTAGQLLVVCEALERAMIAGAAVSSVARLADPGPSMTQHLASWWPPSRFVVLTHPHPAITRAVGDRPPSLGLPASSVPLHFACTDGDPRTRVVVDRVAEQLTGHPARQVETPEESRRRWGAASFTEFSALPQELSGLVRTALDAADECRSCGAPVVWDACRFCHATRGAR